MTDGFDSFFERHREPESRVHTELTDRSRDRIAHVLTVPDFVAGDALDPVIGVAGTSGIPDEAVEAVKTTIPISIEHDELHELIVTESETEIVLSYLEYLFLEGGGKSSPTGDSLWHNEYIEETKDIFETEGLLWKVMVKSDEDPGVIEFHPLESEAMLDIDTKVRSLAEDELWEESLRGYNSAYERYLDGDYDEVLVKKLYNSVEDVLKTICVDEEAWTDNRELSHSNYLEILKEKGVFNANGITAPELNNLLQGLEQLVAKLGKDRKQRHNYIDRTYCTLLLHQVGAFLYFLINRYEAFSAD